MRAILAVILLGAAMAHADEPVNINTLWNFQNPKETRARFEALKLELLTQIARTHGLEGNFDEAHRVLDEVKRQLDGAPAVVRVRYMLERGRTFNSSGKKEPANELFQKAFDLAREAKEHGYAVDALHMLGYAAQGEPRVKLGWEEKAVAYAEKCNDERALKWLGSLTNNITWSYHDLGRFDDALDTARKCERWYEERHKGTRGHRIARWLVGRMLRANKRHDEAITVQQRLAEDYKELGEKDGFVQEELGENLLAKGEASRAQPHFARAYEILKDTWVKDEKDRMERLRRLAER